LQLEPLEGRALLTASPSPIKHAVAHVQPTPVIKHDSHENEHHHALKQTIKLPQVVHQTTHHLTRSAVAQPAAKPRASASPKALASAPYSPSQIRHAYGFDQVNLTGAGQTIAIVVAFDDPYIASDLAKFSSRFNLPAANFEKVVPASGTPAFDAGWAGEAALDVEWAHATAPGAKILLVEAASDSLDDLLAAVDVAVARGAKQVSMSWGGDELFNEADYDVHFNHPGVTFLNASGDAGAGASYPGSSPYVTTVGGTSLKIDTSGNRVSESAWVGSGGGISAQFGEARPSYQNGFTSSRRRASPDVSYNSDTKTGFYVYDSSSGGSWYTVGGTSAGTPQWAGIMALVNQGRAAAGKSSIGTGTTYGTNQYLYALAGYTSYTNYSGYFLDITTGSNGYAASRGYDLATGLGSPVVNKLVPALIKA
jgi:subtilase family serine protease